LKQLAEEALARLKVAIPFHSFRPNLLLCAGDYFVLKNNLRHVVFPVYAVMCLSVTFYALAQLPLYLDLIHATFKKVPQRSDKAVPL
jgi:hypothetical protein